MKSTVRLPDQLLQEHSLSPNDIVSVNALGLPPQYRVVRTLSGDLTLVPLLTSVSGGAAAKTTIGGNDVSLNSRERSRVYFTSPPTFSLSTVQSNVFDSGSLFAGVNLAGDVYCYLIEQRTGKKFAKIQLRSGNGYIDFNTHTTDAFTDKEFALLQHHGAMQFMLVSARNEAWFSKGLRLSGTFAIKSKPIVPPIIARLL
ncbi:MAG: hypothetical protein EOO38_32405 [Cytophagaceae bacterium]|nr:MAG: hypothetical protein EOO38_32405 [Cytophagaceae bacterium]